MKNHTRPIRFSRGLGMSAIVVLLAAVSPVAAFAACSDPVGAEGDMVYNTSYNVMMFCDDTDWVSMSGGGGGGSTAWGDLTGVPAGFSDGTDDGITSESDPKVGTLTNTKWCTTNGTIINCTSDAPSGGGLTSVNFQIFTSSGTWTKPGAGTVAHIECWGGGGGGRTSGGSDGGGGGGGAYVHTWKLLSSMGGTETVTVGSGGAAGSSGGTSSVGAHVSAPGGGSTGSDSGGSGGSGGATAYNGGAGGTGNNSWQGDSSIGSDAIYGGAGGNYCWEGDGNGITGGRSVYGGDGGACLGRRAGQVPGGGGARAGAGGAGMCQVTVF